MSFITELKRRNVFRVAIAYLVVAWLLAQVSGTFESALNLPPWFDSVVVSLLMIGFPVALFFSWAYEITPEGIKREKDIKRDDSITTITAKKLDYLTIFAAWAVLGMFVWQQFGAGVRTPRQDSNDKAKENAFVSPVNTSNFTEQPKVTTTETNTIEINNKSIRPKNIKN